MKTQDNLVNREFIVDFNKNKVQKINYQKFKFEAHRPFVSQSTNVEFVNNSYAVETLIRNAGHNKVFVEKVEFKNFVNQDLKVHDYNSIIPNATTKTKSNKKSKKKGNRVKMANSDDPQSIISDFLPPENDEEEVLGLPYDSEAKRAPTGVRFQMAQKDEKNGEMSSSDSEDFAIDMEEINGVQEDTLFSECVSFQPDEVRSYLFVLKPIKETFKIEDTQEHTLGRLIVHWRNYFGDYGTYELADIKTKEPTKVQTSA